MKGGKLIFIKKLFLFSFITLTIFTFYSYSTESANSKTSSSNKKLTLKDTKSIEEEDIETDSEEEEVKIEEGDILDWQGADYGEDSTPLWLKSILEDKDISPLCKRFKVNKRQKIFIGIGESINFERAKVDAQRKIYEVLSPANSIKTISGLTLITSFWQVVRKEGKDIYTVYLLYRK